MQRRLYIIDDIVLFNVKLKAGLDKVSINYIDQLKDESSYEIIIFYTYNYNTIKEPLKKFAKIYSKFYTKKILLVDQIHVKILKLGLARLIGETVFYCRDITGKNKILYKMHKEVIKLLQDETIKKYNQEGQPLYIKTTLSFGVQSGGMVAHSTGVLGALKLLGMEPEIFTTDYFDNSINSSHLHRLEMKKYHNFTELRELYFNKNGYQEIRDASSAMNKSFVYERCALNIMIGAKLSNYYKIPFVLEYNNPVVWVSKNWGNGLKYTDLAYRIEQANLEQADLIVCVSNPLKELLISRGIPDSKILVNYNGTDINKYHPNVSGDAVRKKLNIKDQIVIGFAGSFDPYHGVEVLAQGFVKLLKEHKEYKNKVVLLLIGDGAGKKKIEKMLKTFVKEGSALFTGSVPFGDMPEYLAVCDILVASHIRNKDKTAFFGSPTKLFEYMAMGKGIIASELEQIGEIFENGKTALLTKPEDVDMLMQKMMELVENKELRLELGRNARKEAETKYTWEIHVKKVLEKLNDIYQGK